MVSGGSESGAAGAASERDLQDLIRLLSNPGLVEQLKQRLPEMAEQEANARFSMARAKARIQQALARIEVRLDAIAEALTRAPRLPRALSLQRVGDDE